MPFETLLPAAQPSPRSFVPVFSRSFGSWQLTIDRQIFAQADLAEHYDRKSGDWHATIARHGFAYAYERLICKVLRQPRYEGAEKALRVLDAGIGTGAMAVSFRKAIGRRIRIDGIDISSEMLRQAHDKLYGCDVDLALQEGELSDLSFPDNSFDVVLVAHVLEHLPDPQVALAEVHRVLKPGGVLICCITRRSLVGAYIQLLWRTHQVDVSTALRWLRQSGLQSVRAIPLTRATPARRFSIGYVGRKPRKPCS